MKHGTVAGYKTHMREGFGFPEDCGQVSCGCRMAHRLYNDKRNTHGYTACTICSGRCWRRDDGLCAKCRKAVKVQPRDDPEVELTGGEWVPDKHGVLHYIRAGVS